MPRAFSLLELVLVLALVGIVAAIAWPALGGVFGSYAIDRAAESVEARIARTRLAAMEHGVPHAFAYAPGADRFWTWACEPVEETDGTAGLAVARERRDADAYDRRYFELNDRPEEREFRFLPTAPGEALTAMGLDAETRAAMPAQAADSVAGSALLPGHKVGLVGTTARSRAALAIPGLQLGEAADPIVFEPDGSADKDAVIRIADRSGRSREIVLHALSGATTLSRSDAGTGEAAGDASRTTAAQRRAGPPALPSRVRELRRERGVLP